MVRSTNMAKLDMMEMITVIEYVGETEKEGEEEEEHLECPHLALGTSLAGML